MVHSDQFDELLPQLLVSVCGRGSQSLHDESIRWVYVTLPFSCPSVSSLLWSSESIGYEFKSLLFWGDSVVSARHVLTIETHILDRNTYSLSLTHEYKLRRERSSFNAYDSLSNGRKRSGSTCIYPSYCVLLTSAKTSLSSYHA